MWRLGQRHIARALSYRLPPAPLLSMSGSLSSRPALQAVALSSPEAPNPITLLSPTPAATEPGPEFPPGILDRVRQVLDEQRLIDDTMPSQSKKVAPPPVVMPRQEALPAKPPPRHEAAVMEIVGPGRVASAQLQPPAPRTSLSQANEAKEDAPVAEGELKSEPAPPSATPPQLETPGPEESAVAATDPLTQTSESTSASPQPAIHPPLPLLIQRKEETGEKPARQPEGTASEVDPGSSLHLLTVSAGSTEPVETVQPIQTGLTQDSSERETKATETIGSELQLGPMNTDDVPNENISDRNPSSLEQRTEFENAPTDAQDAPPAIVQRQVTTQERTEIPPILSSESSLPATTVEPAKITPLLPTAPIIKSEPPPDHPISPSLPISPRSLVHRRALPAVEPRAIWPAELLPEPVSPLSRPEEPAVPPGSPQLPVTPSMDLSQTPLPDMHSPGEITDVTDQPAHVVNWPTLVPNFITPEQPPNRPITNANPPGAIEQSSTPLPTSLPTSHASHELSAGLSSVLKEKPSPIDLEQLTQQVYDRLRRRLRVEQERSRGSIIS